MTLVVNCLSWERGKGCDSRCVWSIAFSQRPLTKKNINHSVSLCLLSHKCTYLVYLHLLGSDWNKKDRIWYQQDQQDTMNLKLQPLPTQLFLHWLYDVSFTRSERLLSNRNAWPNHLHLDPSHSCKLDVKNIARWWATPAQRPQRDVDEIFLENACRNLAGAMQLAE